MPKSSTPNSFSPDRVFDLFAARDPDYEIRAEPLHPDGQAFLACWETYADERDLVIGQDIPSRPFACFLANLMVAEPNADQSDCSIRLAGTSVRQRYGQDVSGKNLSALFSSVIFELTRKRLQIVRETGIPLILGVTVPRQDAPSLHFEVIMLRAYAPDRRAMWNVIATFRADPM